MSTNLVLTQPQEMFNFNGSKVRITKKEDGTIWFVAADVCKILGLDNPTQALKRLYPHEKMNTLISNEGISGNPNKNIISESGLYKLIMRSTKPEAIRFQDWVTQEVLPTIRQQGGYINFNDARDPYTIIDNMHILAKEMDRRLKLAESKVIELKPQAQFAQDFTNLVEEDISFNTMAKLSKFTLVGKKSLIGGKLLKDECIKQGLVGKNRLPMQIYVNKGYFKVFYVSKWDFVSGCFKEVPTTLITPKGQKWLYNRLLKVFNKVA